MPMVVTLGGETVDIDAEVFELLFDNSSVRSYKGYTAAMETGEITFSELLKLARKAHIPYPLFFAPSLGLSSGGVLRGGS